MNQKIYLVGMMGAGKTSVGKLLAKKIGVQFIDTDLLIEERLGVSIEHIFDIEGETSFRMWESKILLETQNISEGVIATGGGIILSDDNCSFLKRVGTVLWLDAPHKVMWKRVEGGKKRPLLNNDDAKMRFIEIYYARRSRYAGVADHVVNVSGIHFRKTINHIHKLLAHG